MANNTRSYATNAAAFALCALLVGCGLSPQPLETPSTAPKDVPTSELSNGNGAPNDVVPVVEDGGEAYAMSDMAAEGYWGGYYEEDFNTEEYASVEESGFVSTRTAPLSTVSADVDTASYANLRRMLMEGYRVQSGDDNGQGEPVAIEDDENGEELRYEYPDEWYEGYGYAQTIPTGAVRIEEMVNYFDYDYDMPTGNDGFAISARVGECPWNKDTKLLMLGYATPTEDPSVREKGANLVFLIDVSGSMDEADKLPLLQSAFGELVDELGENDRVSIVTYSGEEEVVLEGESGGNHRAIMKAIRGLRAEGSTNGEAGLRMAYDVAQDNFIEGGANRIVMASDGDLNVGMSSESDLHDFVSKKRATGIYLSVLGFGAGNYKDTKMETLADNGNGQYHYIDCEDEAKRVFGERLCANLVPFANDVKVQVEFNPAQIKGYRLIGYENRTLAAEDFEDDEKDAGEVGPESQFTVLYEIVPTDSVMDIAVPDLKYGKTDETASTANAEWLTAKLRYAPIDGGGVQEQELVVDEKSFAKDPGDDWRFAAAVAEFGMILRNSEFKGTATYDTVRELAGKPADEARKGFLDLVGLAENN